MGYRTDFIETAIDLPLTLWSARSRRALENGMDVETAVYLRCHLMADFAVAGSWSELLSALAAKGFELGFHEDRLSLIHGHTGVVLCSCRFLGFGLPGLTRRLGKPHVDAATRRIVARG